MKGFKLNLGSMLFHSAVFIGLSFVCFAIMQWYYESSFPYADFVLRLIACTPIAYLFLIFYVTRKK